MDERGRNAVSLSSRNGPLFIFLVVIWILKMTIESVRACRGTTRRAFIGAMAGTGLASAQAGKSVVLRAVLQLYQTAEIDFVPQEAGLALFHCHQQMHLEMGFKRLFRVV
jgi:hypothetical protein